MATSEQHSCISDVFEKIGDFTWNDAESWAGFCDAVGMDPIPFLKVMLESICPVHCCSSPSAVPGCPSAMQDAELWVVLNGKNTRFFLVE